MSSSARRSPRNHAGSHPSTASSRHLSSTSHNQHNTLGPRSRVSASPKEGRIVGSERPSGTMLNGRHMATSPPLASAPVASAGSPTGSAVSGGSSSLSSASVSMGMGGTAMQQNSIKSTSHKPSQPTVLAPHYSPYHTRSTPNLTTGSASGSSPALLSPTASPAANFTLRNDARLEGTPCIETLEPLMHAASSSTPITPTKTRRNPGVSAVNIERDLNDATPQSRSGSSVEGILLQSGGAEKVNIGANIHSVGPGSYKDLGHRKGTRSTKGKDVDYGDRFIPQRSNIDLVASYSLLPDGPEATAGFVPSGIYGEGIAASMNARRLGMERNRKRTLMAEGEGLRDEADQTYTNLIKNELFGPGAVDRPLPTHTTSAPTLSHRSPAQSATPYASGRGHDMVLASLPAHSPSTPRSSSAVGAFASGGARTSQPNPILGEAPVTPTKRRVLDFASPTSKARSSPTARSGGAHASPGNIKLGHTSATGVGMGLDDMMHEKYCLSPIGRGSQQLLVSKKKPTRWISKTPFKVLDAPELADDFYLNLVSWSSSNLLAVGLRSSVYLWSAVTSDVSRLCDFAEGVASHQPIDEVTGLEWTNRGSTVAIGTRSGKVEIWDAEANRRVRTMNGHTGRVGALAWNGHVLSTGSRDRTILHRDTRVREHHFEQLKTHRQEVCGLKWNTTTNQLASGGNDNKLYIWDKTNPNPLYKFTEHCAAVKAIAWSPHHNGLLATGGGTADKKIRYWNTVSGSLLSEWDTGSQVCNLMWSTNSNEIVSTHGYSGGAVSNQICLWKYPTMNPVATLTGHTMRVLYLAMSPDGQTIVTGAGDETLRFWNAFQKGRNGEAPRNEAASEEAIVALRDKRRDESALNPFARIR